MPSEIIRPDPRILTKMKEYDKQLDAFFNIINERWTVVRWISWLKHEGTWRGIALRRYTDVPWPVLCVQDDDGGYLPLDERVLVLLWEGDLQKIDNLDRHFDRRDQMVRDIKEKMQRDFYDDVRHLSIESKRQLMKAFAPFDGGKWTESAAPPVPMSHAPKEVDLDVTF